MILCGGPLGTGVVDHETQWSTTPVPKGPPYRVSCAVL